MLHVVGCIMERPRADGECEILLLHRRHDKPEGGTLGLPSGKVEADEGTVAAMLREMQEETGYGASSEALTYVGVFEGKTNRDGIDIRFETYRIEVPAEFEPIIEEAAHTHHVWATADDLSVLNEQQKLIYGLDTVFTSLGYLPQTATIWDETGRFEVV